MIFCSFFIHCLISENFWKIFRSMKEEIFRNRTFNLSRSDKSVFRIVCFLRFRLIDIFFFRKDWIQIKKCIIIFLNSWRKMSIIMISWMLTKKYFQTKLIVVWIQSSCRESKSSIRCRRLCFCINSWMRSDQRFSRFFRVFENTRQMIQCCSFFTSIINIYFS
jgi:hypothetical protein